MAAATLETTRLVLRPYVADDRPAFVALNGDPVVRRSMNGPLSPEAGSDLFDRVARSDTAWAIVERTSGAYIGHAFLTIGGDEPDPELGFLLDRSYWGRGYATEAAARALRHATEALGCARIVATADTDNHASIRVLEKLGFALADERTDEHGPFGYYALVSAPDA